MTARLKKNSQLNGNAVTELEPVKHLSVGTFHVSRTSTSECLPRIAGIAMGVQNVRSAASLMVNKTAKNFPSSVRLGRLEKRFASKSVQVSSDEESLSRSKIKALQNDNLSLRALLKEKEATLLNLNKAIQDKGLQFAKDMERETKRHKATRKLLEESQNMVGEKVQLLDESVLHYETMTEELQNQYEETVTSLKKQSLLEISCRDEKISKLKDQISDLFKDKSWEHQQQLEELRNELNRSAEETQLLRIRLKRGDTSKKECEQCRSLALKLEDQMLQLKLKDRTIEELQSTCRR
ncbi:hypothetical protein FKM82_010454 [Ascaphus truei]